MDLERLDEAIEFLDGWDIDAAWVDEAHAALRAYRDLLANGERVEWCEEHHQAARPTAPTCIMVAYLEAVRATVADPCRIVSRLLVDYPKEAE